MTTNAFVLVVAIDPDAERAYASPIRSENDNQGKPIFVYYDATKSLKVGQVIYLNLNTYDDNRCTYMDFEPTNKRLPTRIVNGQEVVAFKTLVLFNEHFSEKEELDGLVGWNLKVGRVITNDTIFDSEGTRIIPGMVYEGIVYCPALGTTGEEMDLMGRHETMWFVRDLGKALNELRPYLKQLFTQEIALSSPEHPADVWSFLPPYSLSICLYGKPLKSTPRKSNLSPVAIDFRERVAQSLLNDTPTGKLPKATTANRVLFLPRDAVKANNTVDLEKKVLRIANPAHPTINQTEELKVTPKYPEPPARRAVVGFGGGPKTTGNWTPATSMEPVSLTLIRSSTPGGGRHTPGIAYIVWIVPGKYAVAYNFQHNLIWYDLTKIPKLAQLQHDPTNVILFKRLEYASPCPGNGGVNLSLQAVDVCIEEDPPTDIRFQLCTSRTENFSLDHDPEKETIKCRLQFGLVGDKLVNEVLESKGKQCYFPSHVVRDLQELNRRTGLSKFEIFIRVRPDCGPDEEVGFEYHCMYDETSGTKGSMNIRSYVSRRGYSPWLMADKKKAMS